MKKVLAFAAVAALAIVGCRTTSARKNVVDNTKWQYGNMLGTATKDMVLDLFDIAYVNFGVGDGILAEVQFTKIGHAGAGWADTIRFGTRPRAIGTWAERQSEYGLSLFYWRDISRQAVYGTSTLFDASMSYKGFDMDHQNETGHWLDVGAHVHAFLIGAEAYASPKEALDFVFSATKWIVTLIPIRSGLHSLGCDVLWIDPSSDDSDSKWKEIGGDSAGAVHQGETPFYERTRDGGALKAPDQPVEKK